MKANLISMNILVDSSGSMKSIASDMVGGLNTLVDENRELNVLVTYSIFSEHYQPIFADKPIKDVEQFILRPTRRTALIESACKMIDEVEERLAAKPENERPEKVMFVIITDGLENSSAPEYTKERLLEKIREQTEVHNWVFLYLGADQDAIAVAKSYGIAADKAVNYEREAAGMASSILSGKVRKMTHSAPSAVQDIGFNEEDRKKLKD